MSVEVCIVYFYGRMCAYVCGSMWSIIFICEHGCLCAWKYYDVFWICMYVCLCTFYVRGSIWLIQHIISLCACVFMYLEVYTVHYLDVCICVYVRGSIYIMLFTSLHACLIIVIISAFICYCCYIVLSITLFQWDVLMTKFKSRVLSKPSTPLDTMTQVPVKVPIKAATLINRGVQRS